MLRRSAGLSSPQLFGRTMPVLCAAAPTAPVDQRKLIQQLRARTDAPILDCKRALNECGAGDIEKCVEWLKKKGVASADKKLARETAFGVVGVAVARRECGEALGAVVFQLCSETDFAARNEKFLALAAELGSDMEALIRAGSWEPLQSVEAAVSHFHAKVAGVVAQVGENIAIRKVAPLTLPTVDGDGSGANVSRHVGCYVHGNTDGAKNAGSLVAVTFLTGAAGPTTPQTIEVANDIAQTCVANYYATDTPLLQHVMLGYPNDLTIAGLAKREQLALRRVFMLGGNDDARDEVIGAAVAAAVAKN